MMYRIYAGSENIVSEEDFDEYDNGQPYYDDYAELDIDDSKEDWNTIDDFEAYIFNKFHESGLM